MARNTTTASATTTDAAVTPDTTDADTTRYVPTIADVVDAWRRGDIRRDAARTFITNTMTDAIVAGDTDGAMAAANTMRALDDAVRTPAARAFDITPYVAATVARVVAMTDAAASLSDGSTVPTDIPDAHRDAFVDAIRDAFASIGVIDGDGDGPGSDTVRATDAYRGARANADGFASNRVIGNADVSRHMADIVAGRGTMRGTGDAMSVPVGTWLSFASIANVVTPEYPATVARPTGAVAARFRRGNTVTDNPPAGWVYASNNNTHGARYVGTNVPTPDGRASFIPDAD